jgi:hypothetical protein
VGAPLIAAVLVLGGSATATAARIGTLSDDPRLAALHAPATLVGQRLRVVATTRRPMDHFRAWLDQKPITRRFEVITDRRRIATLPRGAGLAPGLHRITASATAGRHSDFEVAEVLVTRPSEGLLGVSGERVARDGVAQVVVRAHARLRSFRATLNGKRVRDELAEAPDGSTHAALSAAHGLRHGVNELRVVATTESGRRDVDRVVIRVPRGAPLPSAGHDVDSREGATVELDGTDSRPAAGERRVGHRWRIVSAPKGSDAQLRGAASSSPSLRLDEPGRYRIAITARAGGAAHSKRAAAAPKDVMTAEAMAKFPPLGLQVLAGDVTSQGIQIGDCSGYTPADCSTQTYSVGNAPSYLQLVPLDPYLNPGSPQTLPINSTQDLINALQTVASVNAGGNTVIVAAQAVNISQGPSQALQQAVEKAFDVSGEPTIPGPSSFVGVALPQGQGLFRPQTALFPGSADLNGYLELNSQGQVVYAEPDYLPFSSSGADAASAQITLGSQTVTPAAPPNTGDGFLAAAFDAVEPGGGAFQSGTFGDDAPGLSGLAQFITANSSPDTLVAVQSIGRPSPSTAAAAWAQVADALAKAGLSEHTFNTLNTPGLPQGGYAALYGQDADQGNAQQVSGSLIYNDGSQASASDLNGVLSRNEFGRYEVVVQSPGNVDFELLETIYSQGGQFPQYTGDDATIYGCISQQVADNFGNDLTIQTYGDDLRVRYWADPIATDIQDLTGYINDVTAADCPGQDFDAIQQQLNNEVLAVQHVRGLLGSVGSTSSDLQDFYEQNLVNTSANNDTNPVDEAVQNVVSEIDANPDGGVGAEVFGMIEGLVELAAGGAGLAGVGQEAQAGLDAMTNMVAGSVDASSNFLGGPGPLAVFHTEEKQLTTEISEQFEATIAELPVVAQIAVSDYGKLQAVNTLAEQWPAGSADAQSTFDLSIARWATEAVAQAGLAGWNIGTYQPSTYECEIFEGGESGGTLPLSGTPPNAVFTFITGYADTPPGAPLQPQTDNVALAVGFNNLAPDTLKSSFGDTTFGPPAINLQPPKTSGLGEIAPLFFAGFNDPPGCPFFSG